MKSLILTLSAAVIILLVALIGRHSSANHALESARQEITSLTNQMEITSKTLETKDTFIRVLTNSLAEKEQALRGLSNQLATVHSHIVKLETARHAAEEKVRQGDEAVQRWLAGQNENQQTTNRMAELIQELQADTLPLANELRETRAQCREVQAQLNQSEIERADLLARFNDLATIRVQYKRLKATPRAADYHGSRKQKFEVQPDGSIKLASIPPEERLQPFLYRLLCPWQLIYWPQSIEETPPKTPDQNPSPTPNREESIIANEHD